MLQAWWMDNGCSVAKSPWHMANKPACTRGEPADKQVHAHAHAFKHKHAHNFSSIPRSCRQWRPKVNTKQAGWDEKLLSGHWNIAVSIEYKIYHRPTAFIKTCFCRGKVNLLLRFHANTGIIWSLLLFHSESKQTEHFLLLFTKGK